MTEEYQPRQTWVTIQAQCELSEVVASNRETILRSVSAQFGSMALDCKNPNRTVHKSVHLARNMSYIISWHFWVPPWIRVFFWHPQILQQKRNVKKKTCFGSTDSHVLNFQAAKYSKNSSAKKTLLGSSAIMLTFCQKSVSAITLEAKLIWKKHQMKHVFYLDAAIIACGFFKKVSDSSNIFEQKFWSEVLAFRPSSPRFRPFFSSTAKQFETKKKKSQPSSKTRKPGASCNIYLFARKLNLEWQNPNEHQGFKVWTTTFFYSQNFSNFCWFPPRHQHFIDIFGHVQGPHEGNHELHILQPHLATDHLHGLVLKTSSHSVAKFWKTGLDLLFLKICCI